MSENNKNKDSKNSEVNSSRLLSNRRYEAKIKKRSKELARKTKYITILSILLSITLFILFIVIFGYRHKTSFLTKELSKKKEEIYQLKLAQKQLKKELNLLTEERLPNLLKLEIDKVIVLNHGFIKNIVFALTKHNSKKKYEYKLIMENKNARSVHPKFKILVFDRLGIQIGMDNVEANYVMKSGETRSHSSVIYMHIQGEPKYFYVVEN